MLTQSSEAVKSWMNHEEQRVNSDLSKMIEGACGTAA